MPLGSKRWHYKNRTGISNIYPKIFEGGSEFTYVLWLILLIFEQNPSDYQIPFHLVLFRLKILQKCQTFTNFYLSTFIT